MASADYGVKENIWVTSARAPFKYEPGLGPLPEGDLRISTSLRDCVGGKDAIGGRTSTSVMVVSAYALLQALGTHPYCLLLTPKLIRSKTLEYAQASVQCNET